MSDLADYLDQLKPKCYVHCLVEELLNGAYNFTFYDDIEVCYEFGQLPSTLVADYFLNHWQISDDTSGTGNVKGIRITLTHYADKMPMRWDWSWDEAGNTVSGFIKLTGSTVTKTFTPTYADFSISTATSILFTAPT